MYIIRIKYRSYELIQIINIKHKIEEYLSE